MPGGPITANKKPRRDAGALSFATLRTRLIPRDDRSAELIVEADARQAAAGVVVEARLEGRDSRNSGADVPRVAEIVVHIFALDRPIACELVLGTSADRPADLHARTRCKIVNRSIVMELTACLYVGIDKAAGAVKRGLGGV